MDLSWWMKVIGESQLAERRSRRIARPRPAALFAPTQHNTYRRIQPTKHECATSKVRFVCARSIHRRNKCTPVCAHRERMAESVYRAEPPAFT